MGDDHSSFSFFQVNTRFDVFSLFHICLQDNVIPASVFSDGATAGILSNALRGEQVAEQGYTQKHTHRYLSMQEAETKNTKDFHVRNNEAMVTTKTRLC